MMKKYLFDMYMYIHAAKINIYIHIWQNINRVTAF